MVRRPQNLLRTLVARSEAWASAVRRNWAVASHAGLRLENTVYLAKHVEFKVTDGGEVSIAGQVFVGRGVFIQAHSGSMSIGARSFIGHTTTIVCRDSICIGDDCLIAERVTIRDQDHSIHANPEVPIHSAGMETAPIRIGNNVWIAAGAVVLKGTAIGDGAVVAANAVVRGDVPARAIVAGAPARIVGYRRVPA